MIRKKSPKMLGLRYDTTLCCVKHMLICSTCKLAYIALYIYIYITYPRYKYIYIYTFVQMPAHEVL